MNVAQCTAMFRAAMLHVMEAHIYLAVLITLWYSPAHTCMQLNLSLVRIAVLTAD